MDELQLRNTIIAKARRKYIPSHTMNISEALELYLKNDATKDEQIPLQVSTNNRPKNWVDANGRPGCPKCGTPLLLNQQENKWVCSRCVYEKKIESKQCPECSAYMIPFPVNVSPSTQVDKQYNSVWICMNKTCMETIYTPDTIHDIIKAATKAVTNDITSPTNDTGGKQHGTS